MLQGRAQPGHCCHGWPGAHTGCMRGLLAAGRCAQQTFKQQYPGANCGPPRRGSTERKAREVFCRGAGLHPSCSLLSWGDVLGPRVPACLGCLPPAYPAPVLQSPAALRAQPFPFLPVLSTLSQQGICTARISSPDSGWQRRSLLQILTFPSAPRGHRNLTCTAGRGNAPSPCGGGSPCGAIGECGAWP